jgi:uncharacterized membrane protein
MIRRRSTPWIHYWSRPLIGAIATLGILNTGYLTYEKLTGGTPICNAGELKVVWMFFLVTGELCLVNLWLCLDC